MLLIVFTMIFIVATMILIVLAKIGTVLKHLKYVWVNCFIIANYRAPCTLFILTLFFPRPSSRAVYHRNYCA